METYPTVLFYYKGQEVDKPFIVKEDMRMSSLRNYVDDMLDGRTCED